MTVLASVDPRIDRGINTILVHACAFESEFCLSSGEVIFCQKRGHREEKQEVQQRAFVWLSTTRPVIYTLMGNAIAARGSTTLRERQGEKEREGKSSIMEKGAPVCCSGPGQS